MSATTLRSTLTAPRDGIMTDEVGAVTGELELATDCSGGDVTVRLRYSGATEWYRISAADCHVHDSRDHDAVHHALAAVLHRPTAHLAG